MAHLDYNNGYYDGDVNYNNEEHGYGTFVWNDGDKYVGEWRNGDFNGHGVYYYSDGDKYDGEWRDNKRTGYGTLRHSNGNYYVGYFLNNQFHGRGTWYQEHGLVSFEGNWIDDKNATDVIKNDHGKKTHGKLVNDSFEADPLNGYAREDYDNGYYEGNFVNGKRHGQGKYIWNDGGRYDGEWRDGNKHGRGKITYSWGYYDGQWRNDERNGHGTMHYTDGVYTGEWRNDERNGHGTFKSNEGWFYTGDYKDDEMHGHGKFTGDGWSYEGNFVNGKIHGHGKYIWNDGAVYEGEWRDNKRCGQGEMKYSNGHFYKGEWRDNERNGRGTFIFKNENMKYEGEWRDDKPYGRGVITIGDTTYSGIFDGWNSSSVIKTTSTERLGCPGKLIDWKFIPDKLPEVTEGASPTKNKHEYATYSYNLGEYKVTEFEGKKVYYKDGTFSFSPENIERMNRSLSRVLAPIGADGQSVQLHHTTQKEDSPIVEILFSIHKGWDSTLHDPSQRKYGSDINRPNFEDWKKRYWKHRVEEYLKNH